MLSDKLIARANGCKIKGTNITIKKRPDVRNWEVRLYYKTEQKYVVVSSHTEALDDAIIFALNYQSRLDFIQEQGVDIFNTTFTKVANEWLEYMRGREKGGSQSKNTMIVFEGIIKNHLIPYFGKMSINSINSKSIQPYVQHILENGIKAKQTFAHHNMTLSKLLKYAQDKKYYKSVSIPKLEIPVYKLEETEPRTNFTDQEIEKILYNLDRYIEEASTEIGRYNRCSMAAWIHFMLCTGCRTNDLQFMKWGDIELRRDGVDVYKLNSTSDISKSLRLTHLTGQMLLAKEKAYLHAYLIGKRHKRWVPVEDRYFDIFIWWMKISLHTNIDDLVFAAHNGKWYKSSSRWFKEYLEFLEIPDRVEGGIRVPYSLRHTFITKKLAEGANVFDIANQCGTSVSEIKGTYCHMLPDDLYRRIFRVSDDKK